MTKKVLDSEGLATLVSAIKSGELAVGKVKAGGTVPASTIEGVISLANIPKGALERMVVVPNAAARKALNIPEGRTLETLQAELQAQQAQQANVE